MLRRLYELAAEQDKPIAMTTYEPDGEQWLRPLVARLKADYPTVVVHEHP